MALLNYLADEEVKLVMERGVKCPNAKSLGDQLNFGIIELTKEGYAFKGVRVENGKVIKVKYIGECGQNAKKLLNDSLNAMFSP